VESWPAAWGRRSAVAALPQARRVIDGKELSWEEFGRMLMTYEGFQFKLAILDRSDEP
jgi:hypothetical protein